MITFAISIIFLSSLFKESFISTASQSRTSEGVFKISQIFRISVKLGSFRPFSTAAQGAETLPVQFTSTTAFESTSCLVGER